VLPNVGPYIYDVSISGFTRGSIYICDISSLRVNSLRNFRFTDTLHRGFFSSFCGKMIIGKHEMEITTSECEKLSTPTGTYRNRWKIILKRKAMYVV